MADTKITAETLVSALKNAYRVLIACDTGAAPDSNAATMEQVKQFLKITSPPQGRLTPASGTPVLTASDTGNTTMYYTPYAGRLVPLYDGTQFVMTDMGGELSQLLSDTGESPAAAAADSVYDYYAFLKNGSPVLSRARAWESATARDTGNAIEMVEGIYLNKTAYTNGPAANRGTWLGTIATDPSSAEVSWLLGVVASTAAQARLNVWNAYNRIDATTFIADSTSSWTYGTDAWQQWRGQTDWIINYVCGLSLDAIDALAIMTAASSNAGQSGGIGIGIDSASASSGFTSFTNGTAAVGLSARYSGHPGIGVRKVYPLQRAWNSFNITYFGNVNGQSGLAFRFKM